MISSRFHGLGVAAWLISGGLIIGAVAQQPERVNTVKVSPRVASRGLPELNMDPDQRVILLKSLSDAVQDTDALPDPQQRVSTLVNLACGQFLANDLIAARATLAKANEAVASLPGDLTRALACTSMARQLGEYGVKEDARAAVASAVDSMKPLDAINRINVARGIARAQAMMREDVGAKAVLEGAIEALTTMSTEAQWQRSLTMTVDGLLDIEDYDRVLDIAEAIPDSRIDLRGLQLTKLAAKLTKIPLERAKPVLARAQGVAMEISSNPAKAEALARIGVARAESGDLVGAISTAGAIGNGDIDPDVNSFKPLPLMAIAACQATAGDREKAKSSFAEAIRLIQAIGPDSADLRVQRLHAVASTQAKAGMFPDALKTAGLIENNEYHKSLALSEIGNAQVVVKEFAGAIASFQRASELAKEIKDRSNVPNGNLLIQQQHAMSEAACGMASARDFDQALKIAALAMTLDPDARTFYSRQAISRIAEERARSGDIEGALKAAEAIEDEWNRYNAYERIAKLEGEIGNVPEAVSWISKLDDPQRRPMLLGAVVVGLAERSRNLREGSSDPGKPRK